MKIGIIGLGNMGTSVLRLLTRNGYQMSTVITDKKEISKEFFSMSIRDNIKYADILFLCVKPNDVKSVLQEIKKVDIKNKTLVSCVAGVSIKEIKEQIDLPVIRMMGNLPIEYSSGNITYFSKTDDKNFLKLCKGPKIIKLKNEKLLDVTTILSGSMPAFVSYLAQEYIYFGVRNGLNKEQALEIYMSGVEGSMKMLKDNKLTELIYKVSSPEGITMKGIQHLEYNEVNTRIRHSLNFCLENISKLKD